MNKLLPTITCLVLLSLLCSAAATEKLSEEQTQDVSMTVLYDNYLFTEGLKTDWGFSCLVTGTEKTILFDTGRKGGLLLENMERLKAEPGDVEIVVISHDHDDHKGGLLALLEKNSDVSVYLPPSCKEPFVQKVKETGAEVIIGDAPVKICKGVHLTEPMGMPIIEQSMIVDTAKGAVVMTGCAHPGIVGIVRKSKTILPRDTHLVFGGFHLLQDPEVKIRQIISDFKAIGVAKVGATHCTGDKAIRMFKEAYGLDFVQMGLGRTLKIEGPRK